MLILIRIYINLYQQRFLYGILDEDVYMNPPQGYLTMGDTHVWKLLKSLYGLKHAPRKWNEKLCSLLFSFDFKPSLNGYSMFVQVVGNSLVVLLVYLDDIILIGDNELEISKVKDFFCKS